MRLRLYDNVDRYFQFLIFFDLDNMSFQIHDHFLKIIIFVSKRMLTLRSFTRCIFIVKYITFIILLITSLIYTIIMTYLFVLTTLFFTFRIDIREVIFLIFNSKTFFKRYIRLSSVISHSKFEKISFSFPLKFDEYRILKIIYFPLRKL